MSEDLRSRYRQEWTGSNALFARRSGLNKGNFSAWLKGKENAGIELVVKEWLDHGWPEIHPITLADYFLIVPDLLQRVEEGSLLTIIFLDGDQSTPALNDVQSLGLTDSDQIHIFCTLRLGSIYPSVLPYVTMVSASSKLSQAADTTLVMQLSTLAYQAQVQGIVLSLILISDDIFGEPLGDELTKLGHDLLLLPNDLPLSLVLLSKFPQLRVTDTERQAYVIEFLRNPSLTEKYYTSSTLGAIREYLRFPYNHSPTLPSGWRQTLDFYLSEVRDLIRTRKLISLNEIGHHCTVSSAFLNSWGGWKGLVLNPLMRVYLQIIVHDQGHTQVAYQSQIYLDNQDYLRFLYFAYWTGTIEEFCAVQGLAVSRFTCWLYGRRRQDYLCAFIVRRWRQ